MTILANPIKSNMQRPRGQSPGWASFDRKQREKQHFESECEVDPYPSISKKVSSGPANGMITDHRPLMKSFSSVLQPSLDFPLLLVDRESGVPNNASGGNHKDKLIGENSISSSVKRLKNVYNWADENLIEDTLAAVNNDEYQASALLKLMGSSESKNEETNFIGPSSISENYLYDKKNKCSGERISLEKKVSDETHVVLTSGHLLSVPIEPDWEEDDVYLSHRKDAIMMMRAASQHSRAASSAFLKGDHYSAHQLSLRAQGEWMTAEKLNNKAAEEILHIRNSSNDMWKLDLHGLHASEAVSELKEHLHKIESQRVMNCSASSDGMTRSEAGIESLPLFETVSCLDIDAQIKKKHTLSQQRQSVLHVITGTGNHSRGEAALPTAVRSFLIENGYRFDEARPGVIAVRPKFRRAP